MKAFIVFAFISCLLGLSRAQEAEIDHLGRLLAMIDAAAEHHVEAPVRQQMVLNVARSLYRAGNFETPRDLAKSVSKLTTDEEIRAFLEPIYRKHETREARGWAGKFAGNALVESLPGSCVMIPAKEYAVQDQIAANRYVGVGIALGPTSAGVPSVRMIFPDGPLDKVGGKDGDEIWMIDGEDVRKAGTQAVIDKLRGPRGSKVNLVLKPKRGEAKTVDVVRDVVPMKALEDTKILDGGKVAYARPNQLRASLAHELRTLEARLNEKGVGGVVLDLRNVGDGRVHDVKLLADALLPGGVIGRIDDGRSEPQVLEASEDAILSRQLLAVLVDRNTSGCAEWLAAVLQKNNRAIVVGDVTPGEPYAQDGIPIEGMEWVLKMPTAFLGVGRDESLVHWRDYERQSPNYRPQPWSRFVGTRWGVEPDIWVGGDLMNEALRAGVQRGEVFTHQAQEELERRLKQSAT